MNRVASVVAVVVLLPLVTNAAPPLEETVDESYAVDRDATISISNTDGSIRIYAANIAEVHLIAVKKAYSTKRLKGINLEIKATRKSITIDTHYPPKKSAWSFADQSGTVEYTIIVPLVSRIVRCELVNGEVLVEGLQGGSAKAHLVNGWLAGHNCFADLDLSIVNGKLDVAFDWWLAGTSFVAKAESVNGSIRAVVPPDASATIAAESANGKVANNLQSDGSDNHRERSSINVAVGSGDGAQLSLRATNGNIRIDKPY